VQVRVRGEPDWQPVRDSSSAGKNGEILRLAAKGSRNFQALSAAAARLYRGALEVRFRATDRAGNRKYSEVLQLPIDRVAPVAVALGPVLAARREVPVLYRAEDEGRAGVDEVTAWVSPDQGRSWLKAGSAPAARGTVPIKLEKPGVYGLYVTARDRAGNEGAAPRPGTKPQLIMLIDSAAPRAALAGCLIVRADRRRHADGKLDRNQRVELLGSLKSYPDGADIRQWIKNNPGLWAAIFKDHDRNTDGKLDGDELGTLTEHLRHPMTFAEIGDLGGRVFSSSQVLLLKWKVSDDYLPEKEALKVEFSADGGDSWRAVAAGLKNEKTRTGDAQRDERDSYDASFTGSLLWSPPTVNSRRCLLRLRAKDRAGNETVVLSRIFAVDNRAPKSGVDGFEPIRDPGGATGREEGDKPETPAPGALKPPASRPHVEDLLTMAYQCLKAGMRRQAAEKAAEAVKRDPENLAGHLLLGRALAGSDDEAALKYLLRAEKLAPEAEGLAEDLAHVCLRLGCKRAGQGRVRSAHALLTRSADCFQKVLAVRGTGASHYNLGLALLYSARTSKNPASLRARARRALSEAVRLGRDNRAIYAHAHWWLAVLDEEDHRFREAARLWESAAKIYGAESEMGKRSLARARSARRRR
jgi:hypothetical protein